MQTLINSSPDIINNNNNHSKRDDMGDRMFVLQFLQKVQQQHEQQLRTLQHKINQLNQQKQRMEIQLRNLRQIIQVKQHTIDSLIKQNIDNEIQKENENESVRMQKQRQITMTISTRQSSKQSTSSVDGNYRYVREAPAKIVQQLRSMTATQYGLPVDKEEKFKGDLNFIVWSRDHDSLQKIQGRSPKFIQKYLKKHMQIVQFMLIYNNNIDNAD